MDLTNLSIGMSLLLSLFSMAVVFVVLVVITYLIDGTAFLLRPRRKAENPAKTDLTAAPAADAPQEGSQARLTALITAALSAYTGQGTGFVIRKIINQEPAPSGWESAGLQDGLRRPY